MGMGKQNTTEDVIIEQLLSNRIEQDSSDTETN